MKISPVNTLLKSLPWVSSLLTAILITPESFAQEESESNPYINWYKVELIVFKNERPDYSKDPEAWPKNISLAYPPNLQFLSVAPETEESIHSAEITNTRDLVTNIETESSDQIDDSNLQNPLSEADTQAPAHMEEVPFIFLGNDEKQLHGEAQRIDQKRGLSVLFHESWYQPMKNRNDAENIVIIGGKAFEKNNELEGSIKLYLSRYLHIETNLWMTKFEPNFGQESKHWPSLPEQPKQASFDNSESSVFTSEFAIDEQPSSWTSPNSASSDNKFSINAELLTLESETFSDVGESAFVVDHIVLMQNNRRMRSEELHYIDHPRFGILVKLLKFERKIEPELTDIE